MKCDNINISLEFIESSREFEIRKVDENARFWMVRTKGGYFFDEFVKNGFVALGWNIVNKETDLTGQTTENLKNEIKRLYGDERPRGPINKCKRFIFDIKEGDYLLIPSSGSRYIAIAKAGIYYEDNSKDYDIERITISKIDNEECEISQIECPYKKRRKITVLNIIDIDRMSYDLRRAISNFHGISELDVHAEDILNCLYDFYSYRGDVVFTINVNKQTPIRPREISNLMHGLTEYFCAIVEEDILSTTINLNSPGSVRIKLKNGFAKITKAKVPLVFAFIALTGGSAFGFELPGVIGAIKDYKTLKIEIEKEQVELDREKMALEGDKLDSIKSYIELIELAEKQGVDIEELAKQLNLLYDLNGTLNFEASNTIEKAE